MHRTSIAILLALVALCGCAGSRKAIRPGVVVGVVVDDSTGALLRYGVASLIRSDRDVLIEEDNRLEWEGARELSTGSEAKFACDNLAPGFYLVRARYIGYDRETLRLEVMAGDTTVASFRLRRTPGSQRLEARSH